MAKVIPDEDCRRFMETMKKIVQCSVCLETVSPNMMICTRGHIICKECGKQVNKICPTCRGPFSLMQPIVLTQILKLFLACAKFIPYEDCRRFMETLKKIVQCSVCLETVSPNMIICTRGHIICKECKKQVNKICPACRGPFSVMKPTVLFQILKAFPYTCQNTNCNVVFSNGEDHEQFCKYRPTACKLCFWTGVPLDIVQHILRYHEANLVSVEIDKIISLGNFNSNENKVFYSPILAFGEFFWIESINYTVKGFTHNIYWIPKEKPQHEFTVIITLSCLEFELSSKINLKPNISSTLKFESGFFIPNNKLQSLMTGTIMMFKACIKKNGLNDTCRGNNITPLFRKLYL